MPIVVGATSSKGGTENKISTQTMMNVQNRCDLSNNALLDVAAALRKLIGSPQARIAHPQLVSESRVEEAQCHPRQRLH